MKRRVFLAAFPAALGASALANARDLTPVRRGFQEWLSYRDWCESPTGGRLLNEENGDWSRAVEALTEMEDAVLDEPSACEADVILKLLLATNFGDGALPYAFTETLTYAEMMRFAGVPQ